MSTDSRTATATVALVVSLGVTAAASVYLDTLLLFLVVPFVPLLFRGDDQKHRECPVCGFRTRDETYDYCPHDGEELRRSGYQEQ